MTRQITAKEIIARLDSGQPVKLVEALPEKHYQDGHLPGAVQMNHDEISQKAETLLPDKSAFIVTYCASDTCQNSAYAAEALEKLGYTNVHKYSGGKKDWVESGNVLERA